MKRNLFSKVFMAMTATAVIGLASCSNDNDPAGGQELPQGKATGMQLVLDLGGAATRAINDDNAKADETTIEKLNIFIYGENGVLEKVHEVGFAELTDAGNNKYKTKELLATTGRKTIYVGANMTAAMIQTMKATPVTGLSGKGVGQVVANIATPNKFVMFSTVGATPTLVEDVDPSPDVTPAENQVTVNLQRLAAKIAVGMTAQLTDANVQQGAAGQIGDLGFVVDNTNKMYYLTYGGVAATAKDANMTVGQYQDTDFELIPDFTAPAVPYNVITPGVGYVKANGGNWSAGYASENLTEDKMIKGVTRIVVKGKFTPSAGVKVMDDGAGNITFQENVPGHINANATYYLLDFPEAGGYAFFPEATTDGQLKAFMAQKKGVAVNKVTDEMLKEAKKTYKNGLNYWWVTVKDNQGDVLRNHFYKVDVTSIWAPGRTDGKFDPDKDDKPIDKETNITVEVTVEPWNFVEFNADLRP